MAPHIENVKVASEATEVYKLGPTYSRLIRNDHEPFVNIDEVLRTQQAPRDVTKLVVEVRKHGRQRFFGKPNKVVRTVQSVVEFDPKKRHQGMDRVIQDLRFMCSSKRII